MSAQPETTSTAFVEVIADASFEEPIERFIADLELEVRGASGDSALQQVAELSRRCVERLTAGGMARDEIEDAGLAMHRPWWTRDKKIGKEATHKLRLRCADLSRLNRALASIEGVAENTRESINLRMRDPVFRDDDAAARAEALRRAVASARDKATAVAAEAGRKLGAVLHVIEAPPAVRGSGFGDDNDWQGDSGRFAGLGAGVMGEVHEGGTPEPLATPSRTVWVRVRVRFALA